MVFDSLINWFCDFRDKISPRKPKLFFVSSKSTTSTISTSSYCYSTLASVTAACGKKKRSIITDEIDFSDIIDAEATQEDIVSGMEETSTSER